MPRQPVTIACNTTSASIYYTLDGSEPNIGSTLYATAIQVTSTSTIKAKAFKIDWLPSETTSATYSITGTVAMPTFDKQSGIYYAPIEVSISCLTPGAIIRYTLDNSEPIESSMAYSTPLQISASTTAKAKAFYSNWTPSATATANYTITGTVATPAFDPSAGTFASIQTIAISCATPAATIHFTSDGSDPTQTSTAYSTTLQIEATTTIKARAFKTDWLPSSVATAVYTIDPGGDSEAPKISHTIVSNANAATNVTLMATITDGKIVQSAQLFYRRGGAASFTSMPMSGTGNAYSAAIPAIDVSDRGLEYYIVATDASGNSASKPENISSPYVIQVRSSNLSCPNTTPAQAYRMISIPGILDYPAVLSVLEDDLGSYDDTQWRLLRYINGFNIEYGQTGFPAFTPGNGYWLISRTAKTLGAGSAKSVTTAKNFEITLAPGWNQIGNPFAFAVDWSQVVINGEVENKLIGYYGAVNEPSGYDHFRSELTPWEGYFLHNLGTTAAIIEIPPLANSTSLAKTSFASICGQRSGKDWFMQISAQCEGSIDRQNYIGMLGDAKHEWDSNDFSEPPSCFGSVSLSFPHPEWHRYPGHYSGDFRPLTDNDSTWECVINTNDTGKLVSLCMEETCNLSPEHRIILTDRSIGISVDLNLTKRYAYMSTSPSRRFQIKIEPSSKCGQSGAPGQHRLWPNYPNPFNSSTVIIFELAAAGPVHLSVYDISGKLIVDLIDQVYKAGMHQAVWDGRDQENRAVASGIYIIKIQSGNFIQAIRAVLMK